MIAWDDIPEDEVDIAFPPLTDEQRDDAIPCAYCSHPKGEHEVLYPSTDRWLVCHGDECTLRGYYHAFREAS